MSGQTWSQRLESVAGQLAGIEAGLSMFGQGTLPGTLRQIVAEVRDISSELEAAEPDPQTKGS